MGLTESLGVHYNIIDYSGDGFWPLFGECMEAMGRCMRRHDPPAAERRRRIEYLAGWSLAIFSDFAEYYERELEGLCSGVDDLGVWRGVLEAELAAATGERECYWAAGRNGIQRSLARVLEMSGKAKGT